MELEKKIIKKYLVNFYKKVSSKLILNELKNHKHNQSYLISKKNIPNHINDMIKKNDIVITMGAGDIYKTLDNIYNFIK